MLVALDGDIICYRCAASAEQEEQEFIPLSRVSNLVREIMQATGATEHKAYISGPNNFRRILYPAYKANRKQQPPKWLESCERLLIEEFGAIVTDGCEADDMLGVVMSSQADAICASIDKDLNQIEGQHYNFVQKRFEYITPERAIREFYLSMLVGDRTDNIFGVKGIGKAKAPRILEGCETEEEMFDTVRECYNDDAAMLLNGQLLHIWRKEDDIWEFPQFDPAKNIQQDREQS